MSVPTASTRTGRGRLVGVAVACTALATAAITAGGAFAEGDAPFPTAAWAQYPSAVEPQGRSYGIRLTAVDGEPLPEPVLHDDAGGLVPSPGDAGLRRLARTLAGELDDPMRSAFVRRALEDRYLTGLEGAAYELVHVEHDVLARARCECGGRATVIESYEVGR